MKTLYITDLDGTFLNSSAEISETSAEIIRNLIKEGCLFTVATARTKATVLDMFKGIGLNCPIALMNGVMVFDVNENKNLICHNINKSSALQILKIYEKHGKHPMLYFNKNDYLEIVYSVLDNEFQEKYVCDRKNMLLKKFKQVDDLYIRENDELLYIVTLDKPEEIQDIFDEISLVDGVVSSFYKDNYTDCNFLETMNGEISKGTAATEIKRCLDVDRLIAFGDNLNDIPLFLASDECYAVSNAHNKLKKIATGVIASNDEDGVAKFILNHFKNSCEV